MSYKGEYDPSELVCPKTFTWVRLDDKLRSLIDKKLPDV